jgi:hypothetical protein
MMGEAMRRRHECGSALILLLGVVAALVVLVATLVMLITNVQFATSKDRARVKAFNVAEAGLDLGEQRLDQAWPTSESTTVASLTTSDFRALSDPSTGASFLDADEYPGLAAKVTFFDNDDPTDGQMYIRSVARVGGKVGAVQALVSKVQFEVNLPPDMVLYTEGHLQINGQGNEDAVGVETAGEVATAYYDHGPTGYGHTPPKTDAVNDGNTRSADSRSTSLSSVFPSLNDLIAEADLAGRKFANASAFNSWSQTVGGVTYHGWDAANAIEPHIVVIADGDIRLPEGTIWSEDAPGILIVANGSVTFQGHTTFYGLIFCKHVFEDDGTPNIYGTVIAPGGATLKGDRALIYSSKVIYNLNEMLLDSVRVVPGMWRELRGMQAPAS